MDPRRGKGERSVLLQYCTARTAIKSRAQHDLDHHLPPLAPKRPFNPPPPGVTKAYMFCRQSLWPESMPPCLNAPICLSLCTFKTINLSRPFYRYSTYIRLVNFYHPESPKSPKEHRGERQEEPRSRKTQPSRTFFQTLIMRNPFNACQRSTLWSRTKEI